MRERRKNLYLGWRGLSSLPPSKTTLSVSRGYLSDLLRFRAVPWFRGDVEARAQRGTAEWIVADV